MSYTEAVISGIVQGITEFLPVSSSAHLVILHHYFGHGRPQLLFDIFLHIGTLFAVLVYFWNDIIKAVTADRRLLGFLIAGSVSTAVIGFFFHGTFEELFKDVRVVGYMLFVTAGFLFLATWASKRQKETGLGWGKAVIIGLIQGVSLIPGISRSGSTISTGLLLGLDKAEAVRFSFLLAIPAMVGALLFKLVEDSSQAALTPQIFVGSITAFLVGLASIYILFKVVLRNRLSIFGIYCILLGGLTLLL